MTHGSYLRLDGMASPNSNPSQTSSIRRKFDAPGAHVLKSTPHVGMGMVALIQVGDSPANLEAIKTAKVQNMVRKRLDADLAQITQ